MSRPPIVTRPVTTGKMPRYLVTGGAGFIGSHVVDALAARGDAVRVVDDLSTGRRGNLAEHPDVELIEADLADPQVAEAAVTGVECAIHMAAIPSVPRSVQEPRRARRANVDATRALLLAARDAGVRRVVLASSSSVYGESPALPNREALRPAPLSPYARHKLVGERYAATFYRRHGLETVALRLFNVFEPRQMLRSRYSGVISQFTAALLAGRIINIAGGGRLSVNAVYAMLQRIIGVSVTPRYAAPRPGDVRHSQAAVSLARDLLGFAPAVPVEEGLRRTVAWQREQTA